MKTTFWKCDKCGKPMSGAVNTPAQCTCGGWIESAGIWSVSITSGGTFKTVRATNGTRQIVCNLSAFEPVENFLKFHTSPV